jgi:hypothetical protein
MQVASDPKPAQASANCCGRPVRVTHYAFAREHCLSKIGPAGNSAGNFRPRSSKTLNPLANSTELGSSPEHPIFVIYQVNKTLS